MAKRKVAATSASADDPVFYDLNDDGARRLTEHFVAVVSSHMQEGEHGRDEHLSLLPAALGVHEAHVDTLEKAKLIQSRHAGTWSIERSDLCVVPDAVRDLCCDPAAATKALEDRVADNWTEPAGGEDPHSNKRQSVSDQEKRADVASSAGDLAPAPPAPSPPLGLLQALESGVRTCLAAQPKPEHGLRAIPAGGLDVPSGPLLPHRAQIEADLGDEVNFGEGSSWRLSNLLCHAAMTPRGQEALRRRLNPTPNNEQEEQQRAHEQRLRKQLADLQMSAWHHPTAPPPQTHLGDTPLPASLQRSGTHLQQLLARFPEAAELSDGEARAQHGAALTEVIDASDIEDGGGGGGSFTRELLVDYLLNEMNISADIAAAPLAPPLQAAIAATHLFAAEQMGIVQALLQQVSEASVAACADLWRRQGLEAAHLISLVSLHARCTGNCVRWEKSSEIDPWL